MKRILFLSISVLPLFGMGMSAQAADAPAAECGIAAIVEGGVGYQGGNVTSSGFNQPLSGSFTEFGETAFGYGCGNWMAQLDGAYYHSGFSNSFTFSRFTIQANGQDNQGHIGGALFWRDPSVGRIGLAASEILNNAHLVVGSSTDDFGGSLTRVGAFGDFYASDAITLGGAGFYVTGTPITGLGSSLSETGFEGNVHAIFYATDNISLGLQGDMQLANLTESGRVSSWNGYAGSVEAEYLVPDTALSLFLGGRIASRSLNQLGGLTINDQQGYIGVKWAFGGPVSSLRARDRAGTYDNTSVFDEKLPGIYYDLLSAGAL
jgi:hypothetical protein